jgi:hypothetical protein
MYLAFISADERTRNYAMRPIERRNGAISSDARQIPVWFRYELESLLPMAETNPLINRIEQAQGTSRPIFIPSAHLRDSENNDCPRKFMPRRSDGGLSDILTISFKVSFRAGPHL